MIYIAADHAGYNLKEKIKEYLIKSGIVFEDLGAKGFDPKDDYPDFARKMAEKVAKNSKNKGIMICGTGLGSCISANKIKGIRAISAWNEKVAKQSREHLDANVLCLGGRIQTAKEAERIVKIWLKTKFSGKVRHLRRIKKIRIIEK